METKSSTHINRAAPSSTTESPASPTQTTASGPKMQRRRSAALETAGLVGMIGAAIVLSAPKALANKAGFGFKKEFLIGGNVIRRPDHFNTKAHRAAFEDVGRYVTDALTRHHMISYNHGSLEKMSFLHPQGVPKAVWREVLDFYAEAGAIKKYWELDIPTKYGRHGVEWGPNGERLEAGKNSVIHGQIAEDARFSPGLLTDEQKASLLGKPYAQAWADASRGEPVAFHTVTEENFQPTYYRDPAVLSDGQWEKGLDRFKAAAKASQS